MWMESITIMDKQLAILYTTIGSEKEAKVLARLVLDQKLAACINIFPQGKSLFSYSTSFLSDFFSNMFKTWHNKSS